jgi:hypothetical protein
MSNRERWIVYPLLFFAIMMGAMDLAQRNNMLTGWRGPPRFHELRCRQLILEDIHQQPIAVLNQNEFGEVQFSLLHDDGAAAILKAGQGGGDLLLIRESDQKAIHLGHDAQREFTGLQGAFLLHGNIKPLEDEAVRQELIPWPGESEPVEVDGASSESP